MIQITVIGLPAPQGSKSFMGTFIGKDGREHAKMAEASKKVKPWRKAVEAAGRAVLTMNKLAMLDGPIVARMVFTMPKPKSAPVRRRTFPDRTPDLSKLVRATEDALTDAEVIADDARIVGYSLVWKCYPGEHPESLTVPGVRITLQPLAEYELHKAARNG